MTPRHRIIRVVRARPGIRFRDLVDVTGLATGTVQYHVRRSPSLRSRHGSVMPAGFCDSCPFHGDCGDECGARLLQDGLRRRILAGLQGGQTQAAIARALDLSPATISHHVSRMEDAGLVRDGGMTEEGCALVEMLDRRREQERGG